MPFYIVVNPSDDLALMKNEIFGPILPIKTYKSAKDAINYINKGDKPLGLYVFSDNKSFIDEITQNTQSGGVAVNIIALQAGQPSMAFGGVGASGTGACIMAWRHSENFQMQEVILSVGKAVLLNGFCHHILPILAS